MLPKVKKAENYGYYMLEVWLVSPDMVSWQWAWDTTHTVVHGATIPHMICWSQKFALSMEREDTLDDLDIQIICLDRTLWGYTTGPVLQWLWTLVWVRWDVGGHDRNSWNWGSKEGKQRHSWYRSEKINLWGWFDPVGISEMSGPFGDGGHDSFLMLLKHPCCRGNPMHLCTHAAKNNAAPSNSVPLLLSEILAYKIPEWVAYITCIHTHTHTESSPHG